MPEDGNICPHCGRPVAKHEGMIVQSPRIEKKKDNTGLIIAIVLVLIIIIPIAIAATVYVYVSGMIGPETGITMTTPTVLGIITPDSGKNATLSITQIDGNTVYWSSVFFEIYDITDKETLNRYYDYNYDTAYGYVKTGDTLKFRGNGEEFQEDHSYRISLIYIITNEIMCNITWKQ